LDDLGRRSTDVQSCEKGGLLDCTVPEFHVKIASPGTEQSWVQPILVIRRHDHDPTVARLDAIDDIQEAAQTAC
jgi:hypothetical protein